MWKDRCEINTKNMAKIIWNVPKNRWSLYSLPANEYGTLSAETFNIFKPSRFVIMHSGNALSAKDTCNATFCAKVKHFNFALSLCFSTGVSSLSQVRVQDQIFIIDSVAVLTIIVSWIRFNILYLILGLVLTQMSYSWLQHWYLPLKHWAIVVTLDQRFKSILLRYEL